MKDGPDWQTLEQCRTDPNSWKVGIVHNLQVQLRRDTFFVLETGFWLDFLAESKQSGPVSWGPWAVAYVGPILGVLAIVLAIVLA